MQKSFKNFRDLHLFCPHLSKIRRNISKPFTRPFNSSTNTWMQNNSTETHYNLLCFNFKINLHYCATCLSLRLEQFPSVLLPLKTPLPVPYLTSTLILLQPFSCVPALMNHNFVVLPPKSAAGPPRAKTNSSSNADFQSSLDTREAPPTTAQNLTSSISKLENIFADEIATYTSITTEIHSQNFSLYDKIRQLEAGNSHSIIWKIPSVKFVFDSRKITRPSSDPVIEPATSFITPFFRTHRQECNFFAESYPYGIGRATGKCALILFVLFSGDYDNLLQWPFLKLIHIGIRDQLDPLNTWMKTIWPDQDLAYRKTTISTKTGVATLIILYSLL